MLCDQTQVLGLDKFCPLCLRQSESADDLYGMGVAVDSTQPVETSLNMMLDVYLSRQRTKRQDVQLILYELEAMQRKSARASDDISSLNASMAARVAEIDG